MGKIYTESELRAMGMEEEQIKGILNINETNIIKQKEESDIGIPTSDAGNIMNIHKQEVEIHNSEPLKPTSVTQISSYKQGVVVQLPSFADGQPFVARIRRPSMLALVKSGKIPNSLLNQATSLFANGAGALNTNGKNSTSVSDLFDVIDVIVESALLEPTLKEIRSVDMELTDEQLMAIFSYTQKGVEALENFRTK